MENLIPQQVALALFYAAGLAQIILISLYIPQQITKRLRFIFTNFPADQYPKLYPLEMSAQDPSKRLGGLTVFLGLNAVIAAIGFGILASLFTQGYRLADKGGDEIFVLAYFALQGLPLFYVALREGKHISMLRQAYDNSLREADLQPRRLFDFVSPVALAGVVVMFAGWLVFYLGSRDVETQPLIEIAATVGGMSLMNIMFAVTIWRAVRGAGQNPYMATSDKRKLVRTICTTLPLVSMLGSLFLMLTQAADTYALEIIDPVLTSLYMQLCVIFGFGMSFHNLKVETIDFEPYRATSPQS